MTNTKLTEKDLKVIEFKRICNECGQVWHSLKNREDALKKEENDSACQTSLMACSCRPEATAQYNRNKMAAQTDLNSMKKCPKCGSTNFKETEITFDSYEKRKQSSN